MVRAAVIAEPRPAGDAVALPLGDGRIMFHTRDGLRLVSSVADLPDIGDIAFAGAADRFAALGPLIEVAGRTIVHVGAGSGALVCALRRINEGRGTAVAALEPHPALLDLLRQNLRLNASTVPTDVLAVEAGGHGGTGRLRSPPGFASQARFVGVEPAADPDGVPMIFDDLPDVPPLVHEVVVERLDTLFPDPRAIGLLIVDDLDRRPAALLGAERLLRLSERMPVIVTLGRAPADGAMLAARRAAIRPLLAAGFRAVHPGRPDAAADMATMLAAAGAPLAFVKP